MRMKNRSRSASRALALFAAAGAAAMVCAVGVPAMTYLQQDTQAGASASADPALDGSRHALSGLDIRYAREHPGHPSVDAVLDGRVRLGKLSDGYTEPRAGVPTEEVALRDVGALGGVYDAALPVLSQAITTRVKELGLLGPYAEPDSAQIALKDGQVVDLRAGDTRLTYIVTTGRITQLRTQGLGDRLAPDNTLNNAVHSRIRYFSPVRPAPAGGEGGDDLLRAREVDDYLYRLNRHPGRRVDAAVAGTGEAEGAVTLDYLVTENRPWLLYAQAKRDGNRSTDAWRYSFGFIHNQLTNNDDIFSVEYQTSFDNVNSLVASYSRPFANSEDWRWRVFGSWYEYTAADVGLPDATFEGSGYSLGGEVSWNFYQHRDLFLDAVAGLRFEHIAVDNNLADVHGDDNFLIGYLGARMEQRRETFTTNASATLEFSLDGVSDEAQQALGRTNADSTWALLRADVSHSFFLEPLFDHSLKEHTGFAHEIALRAAAQVSLGSRLIPNYQDVVGGLYSVRGYPESIVAGDSTFVASAEYRLHIPALLEPRENAGGLMGEPFRWQPQYAYGPTDWDLIARAFVDVGITRNQDRESFEVDQTLVGAGVGLELLMTRHFRIRADFGWALSDVKNADNTTLIESGDPQWHFVGTLVY